MLAVVWVVRVIEVEEIFEVLYQKQIGEFVSSSVVPED